jgi:hypothetical protein
MQGATSLGQTLRHRGDGKQNIMQCSVANNRLHDSALAVILKGGAQSRSLLDLNLSGNAFANDASKALEQILATGSSADDTSDTAIEEDAAISANLLSSATTMRTSTLLQRLTLSWCGLTLRNLGWLCQGIASSKHLKHLDLSKNCFSGILGNQFEPGHGSMHQLAASIVLGGSVIDLDLSFNSINDNDGVLLLSKLVGESTSMQSITGQCSDSAVSVDIGWHALHRLILDGNHFGERTARQALRAISGAVQPTTPPAAKDKNNKNKNNKDGGSGGDSVLNNAAQKQQNPIIYLSLRDCNFSKGHTVHPTPRSSREMALTNNLSSQRNGNSSSDDDKSFLFPQIDTTLSSFDPQCPHGTYELDCRDVFQRQ